MNDDFSYVPDGALRQLRDADLEVLPRGAHGGDGIRGWYIDLGECQFQEVLEGEYWPSSASDVAGPVPGRNGSVLLLWRVK